MQMWQLMVLAGALTTYVWLSGCASAPRGAAAEVRLSTITESAGTLRVDRPDGRELRLRLDEQTWHPVDVPLSRSGADHRFGRTLRVEPIDGNTPAEATWRVDRPARLSITARLTARGTEAVKSGAADGTVVRLERQGLELGTLVVRSTAAESLTVDITEPGEVSLSVSAGSAADARIDATYLTLSQEDR